MPKKIIVIDEGTTSTRTMLFAVAFLTRDGLFVVLGMVVMAAAWC